MTEKTPEHLLNNQLAACLAAMHDCLAHSRAPNPDDTYGHRRRDDIAYIAKLVKASARLTEAMSKLKGSTRHDIHVTRDAARGDAVRGDKAGG
jgi:hypothetical protein